MTTQKSNSTESDKECHSRGSAELNENLGKSLTAYATAAGAACVGVLALAQPAQADIIVNNNPISIGVGTTVPFQINGVTEFTFEDRVYGSAFPFTYRGTLSIRAGNGQVYQTARYHRSFVSRLAKGAVIGAGGTFAQSRANVERVSAFCTKSCFFGSFGQWPNQSGYIGFEFLSNGQTHFGWLRAQVSVARGGQVTANIDEYAYDTVASQSILAGQTSATPEPGTLSLLALGSLGLGFWRRKRQEPEVRSQKP